MWRVLQVAAVGCGHCLALQQAVATLDLYTILYVSIRDDERMRGQGQVRGACWPAAAVQYTGKAYTVDQRTLVS
jgi:hypothetical protein